MADESLIARLWKWFSTVIDVAKKIYELGIFKAGLSAAFVAALAAIFSYIDWLAERFPDDKRILVSSIVLTTAFLLASLGILIFYFRKSRKLARKNLIYYDCEKHFNTIARENAAADLRMFDLLFVQMVANSYHLEKHKPNTTNVRVGFATIQANAKLSIIDVDSNIKVVLKELALILSHYHGTHIHIAIKVVVADSTLEIRASGPQYSFSPRSFVLQPLDDTPFQQILGKRFFHSNLLPSYNSNGDVRTDYKDADRASRAKPYSTVLVLPIPELASDNDGAVIAYLQADSAARWSVDERCVHYMEEVAQRLAIMIWRRNEIKKILKN